MRFRLPLCIYIVPFSFTPSEEGQLFLRIFTEKGQDTEDACVNYFVVYKESNNGTAHIRHQRSKTTV
jgi:hypothetical protein